jgi:hypothetical protein
MDPSNHGTSDEKPAPKKTLREAYANAAGRLLLMSSEKEVSSDPLAVSVEEEDLPQP